jgi:23S rRNA (guanine2445-N2)-methyltransferase / 23S rRNA (guanine2069-N7)-methyltransferase
MNMRAVTLTCPGGLEALVAAEMVQAGMQVELQARGAVTGLASLESLYRACLWTRHANHVLVRIAAWPGSGDSDDLYTQVAKVHWQDWLRPGQRFVIAASGKTAAITNSQHAIFRAKDAIVDHFVSRALIRPQVDRERPEVQFQLHLEENESAIYLNLNGAPLHERGYRVAGVAAPIKENLAAALAAWAGISGAANAPSVVLDPMCGSGTLLIEAAWLLADVAPGLLREHWGFAAWRHHDAAVWHAVRADAIRRRDAGLKSRLPKLVGYDADPRAVRAAQANANAAGVASLLHIEKQPLASLQRSGRLALDNGVILTNPPYGERLSEVDVAPYLYRCLGRRLRAVTPGWRAVVLAAQVEHLDEFRVADYAQHRCHNGPLACFARVFTVPDQPEARWPAFRLREEGKPPAAGEHLANRLHKNWKQMQGWVEREGVRAFRLYDADLPEYNVAVDIYGDRVHVQEYAAPSSVDPDKAAQRLETALDTIAAVTGKSRKSLAIKVRAKQKGAQQYDRRDSSNDLFEIDEYGARILVNLTDYLDTGLFLDHRPLRHRLQSLCKDKHFLNLFCYTGSATIHAALGGARSTTSVDLNPRYLAWAEANLALNGFSTEQHHLERADVAAALAKGGDQFDVIFMDAPTFSNSKRTPNVLDIQRDHVSLVSGAMRHLAPGGLLLFSNNYRRFKLDESVSVEFDVKDITAQTIPTDFSRNPKIHQCWEIRHRE